MSNQNKHHNKPYSYSLDQLAFFGKEIKKAGGFDELMVKKQALGLKEHGYFILNHENIEEYKKKYLIGVYEPLRPSFNTRIPYSFWSQLYIAINGKTGLKKSS